ncbi:hypothetical protein L596_009290 [Steinernema carpocapsae]|uniref:DUF155 domain-containing protein n=1 Tax=Steinernema carpocapsae TaxID=34508 RepID=A0A4U5PFG2_STECR|nr:hypothetical protein L596_009290 [Steinernema carpocapsae]
MANRFVSSAFRISRGFLSSRQVLARTTARLSTSALRCLPSTATKQTLASRTSRLIRKRRPLTAYCEASGPHNLEIVTVSLSEKLDLGAIYRDEKMGMVYHPTFVDAEFDEALHIIPHEKYIIEENVIRDFFVFSDGVVVFWNVDANERSQILKHLGPHCEGEYSDSLVFEEMDSMPFELTDSGKSRISHDAVLLKVGHQESSQPSHISTLERYAFSHGFAASVKLAIWESQLNDSAEPLVVTTKEMTRGKMLWSRKKAMQKTGEFAALRHSINLNTCLLNDDFYWERPELEEHYKQALKYFAVASRLRQINSKLDYCEECVRQIDSMLSHQVFKTFSSLFRQERGER